jgi:hypothetical protein
MRQLNTGARVTKVTTKLADLPWPAGRTDRLGASDAEMVVQDPVICRTYRENAPSTRPLCNGSEGRSGRPLVGTLLELLDNGFASVQGLSYWTRPTRMGLSRNMVALSRQLDARMLRSYTQREPVPRDGLVPHP